MASQVPPVKGSPFNLALHLYTSSGGLIANPSSVASQVSKDFGSYAAASSVSVISTVYGLIKLALDSTEMNADIVSGVVQDATAGCVPFTFSLYTTRYPFNAWNGVVTAGVATGVSTNSLTLASTTAFETNLLNGATLLITGDTGVGQSRSILSFDSTSKIATVDAFSVTPATNAQYTVFGTPPASVADPMPANVTEWNGASVATPSVSGVPEVDITYLGGVALASTTAQIGANVVSVTSTVVTTLQSGLATSTEVSSGFAAQTAALSTMAASIALRATSTEVSSGFAAQTQILSTMASAVSSIAGGSTLTAAEVATAINNSTIDGAYTRIQVERGIAAVLMGKVSGSQSSTTIFRDINDTKARITAVTDTSGNRTSVTLDLT